MYKIQKLLGFILSRQWRDTADGINLSFWVSTEQGPVHILIDRQQAVCFVRRSNTLKVDASVQRKPLELKTFDHEAVDGLYFPQQRQLNTLREHLAYNKQQLLESEIKPTERYLMERFITASVEISGDAIQREGYLEFINPVMKPAEYDPEFSVVSLDIETEDLRGKLFSIAVTSNDIEVVFMNKDEPETHDGTGNIHWCYSERDVLQQFFQWMKQHDPDVIIGWNVVAFDLDFLQWKCKQLQLPFDIGRGNKRDSKNAGGTSSYQNSAILTPQVSGQLYIARIPGRVVLDGITCLRGAFYSFESFALDYVAELLLGRKKLISEDKNSAKSGGVPLDKLNEIRRQYQEDPVALAEYNLEDCRLVADIFEKTDMLSFSIQRAKMTGLAIDRQGGSTAAFDNLYLPRLHRQGYVAPDIGSQLNTKTSPGGYVMDSLPGLYENVLVLDFKSLYPSIIRTFKIDPMGLAEGLSQHHLDDTIPGFLEAEFSREKHILPDIVTRLWQQRDEAKKENNKPLSYAIKIIMNSFYGVLGSSGCRFFNPQLASSITMRGHEIIQTSKELIEQQGYSVIYGDTDSVFVLLGEGKERSECQSIGEQLQTILNAWWKQHLLDEFDIESNLEIEFETHYLRFLMPTIRGAETGSKKRYAGMIQTGADENSEKLMVFKGLETVRTDWTPLAREFQQELYKRIFNNQPYEDYISATHDALINGELNHKLTYTKRLRRPLESYTSTQPPQVKAARKMKNPGRKIQYVITLNGPEPLESLDSIPDYQHYVDKQLAPVADSILYFLGTTFEKITARQLDVFG
ncbi:DNA polymerase II [uncultured Cocleimonas sp.]|uniref:DNA polymerase II n=1 Tax=uncultured Cocleimonas sp. TaxID=1051587 RepID=UPI00262EFE79|nr:DNA polymerase II [uncultured Cocleimonas sp.]